MPTVSTTTTTAITTIPEIPITVVPIPITMVGVGREPIRELGVVYVAERRG